MSNLSADNPMSLTVGKVCVCRLSRPLSQLALASYVYIRTAEVLAPISRYVTAQDLLEELWGSKPRACLLLEPCCRLQLQYAAKRGFYLSTPKPGTATKQGGPEVPPLPKDFIQVDAMRSRTTVTCTTHKLNALNTRLSHASSDCLLLTEQACLLHQHVDDLFCKGSFSREPCTCLLLHPLRCIWTLF